MQNVSVVMPELNVNWHSSVLSVRMCV